MQFWHMGFLIHLIFVGIILLVSHWEWLKCSGQNPFMTQLHYLLPRCSPTGFFSRKEAPSVSDLKHKHEASCDEKYLLEDLYHQRQSWNSIVEEIQIRWGKTHFWYIQRREHSSSLRIRRMIESREWNKEHSVTL